MKILAFETSCDDTAVAVVEDGVKVLASTRVSQAEHSDWGGVVPEIAARLHAENWRGALEQCLKASRLSMEDIDALAVTSGPGLQPALLNGTTAASTLAQVFEKPLIPVHHIYGHICSVFLDRDMADVSFPSLILTVSGGHTQMHLWQGITELEKLGETLDDAAGEAFDKVAKMLGLGYPGGPIVSKQALKGDRTAFDFPRIYLDRDSLDFSFSGLKAAVYREIEKQASPEDESFVADICASFEAAVKRIFIKKIARALDQYPDIQQVFFVGGVSANTFLRSEISDFLASRKIPFITPAKIAYSTDNAAMIASAAYFLATQNPAVLQHDWVEANPRMSLEDFLKPSL